MWKQFLLSYFHNNECNNIDNPLNHPYTMSSERKTTWHLIQFMWFSYKRKEIKNNKKRRFSFQIRLSKARHTKILGIKVFQGGKGRNGFYDYLPLLPTSFFLHNVIKKICWNSFLAKKSFAHEDGQCPFI